MLSVVDAGMRLQQRHLGYNYVQALDTFSSVYVGADVAFVKAPGRVNIIGEHTDYNGLPVLPAAIDKDIAIAYTPIELAEIELVNADPQHSARHFELIECIPSYKLGDWGNYAKAAAQAIINWCCEYSPQLLPLKGFRGCVASSIPAGSGLSSSSALVVAVACVLVEINSIPINKQDLADLLARGEQYVGTQGGGMDQAASIMGEDGKALKIDFFPLRVRPVLMPRGYQLIVANTMVTANKSGGARAAYNTRVAECKLGLEILKKAAAPEHPAVANARLLRDFKQEVSNWRRYLDNMHDGPMSIHQIALYLGIGEEMLQLEYLTSCDGYRTPVPQEGFQLKKRCRHVLTESERVELAAEAMEQGNAAELGVLMDNSHQSCVEDYSISCDELDYLVNRMKQSGALGARLTGAGFGGCALALVADGYVEDMLDELWESYYIGYLPLRGIKTPRIRDEVLFACAPSRGAGSVVL